MENYRTRDLGRLGVCSDVIRVPLAIVVRVSPDPVTCATILRLCFSFRRCLIRHPLYLTIEIILDYRQMSISLNCQK